MAAAWQNATGFTISGVGNVIATADPTTGANDFYVEADGVIIGDGGYFLFSMPDTGADFSLGFSSASNPSGPPFDNEFEIELRFAGSDFEVYKNGVLVSASPVPYAFDTIFGIYRNSATEWEVFYDDVSIEVLTFGAAPGSLRLAVVAGDDAGGAIAVVIEGFVTSVGGGHEEDEPCVTVTSLTQLFTLTNGVTTVRRTSFDCELIFDGEVFAPIISLPTSLAEADDLSPAQLEFAFALEDSGIELADLAAGKWDRARLLIQWIDWENLATDPVRVWKGVLTQAPVTNGQFVRAEFVSLDHLLNQPIGDLYSELCRVREYGDVQCGKDISAETFAVEVTDVADGANFDIDESQASNYFQYGTLLFTTGLNAGIKKEIKTNTGGALEIVEPFPFAVEIGDEATAVRGCDRTFATCIARANAERFRGEPNIPGRLKLGKKFPEEATDTNNDGGK